MLFFGVPYSLMFLAILLCRVCFSAFALSAFPLSASLLLCFSACRLLCLVAFVLFGDF